VDVDAVDGDDASAPVKVSSCSSPDVEPVQRVGARGPEALDVEARGAAADLLVGREADAQRRARQLGVCGQVGDRGHDLGDAGLVVGAQQRVAARGHDVVTLLAGQLGHRRGIEHGVVARQLDRAAGVGAVTIGSTPLAGRVGARVDMGDEPDNGASPSTVAGRRGHHVAVVVELGVLETRGLELVDEHPREVELAGVLGCCPLPSRRDWVSTRT
jgi:hypothetical protein